MPVLSLDGEVCTICRGARCRECNGIGTLEAYVNTQNDLERRTRVESILVAARVAIQRASEVLARSARLIDAAGDPEKEAAQDLREARDLLDSAADLLDPEE